MNEQLRIKLNINDIEEVMIENEYRKFKLTSIYEVNKLLGQGSFGVVLQAKNI